MIESEVRSFSPKQKAAVKRSSHSLNLLRNKLSVPEIPRRKNQDMTFVNSSLANFNSEHKKSRISHYKGGLGEYQSVATLPQLNKDFSDSVNRRRKSGNVKLTKKEMQNFLHHGTISKDFIKKNKEELNAFIKVKARPGDELQQMMSAKSLHQRNHTADASFESPNKKDPLVEGRYTTIFGSQRDADDSLEITFEDQRLHTEGFYQSECQKTEKNFKGETSTINSRVIETWLNETLAEAENLDIPGSIIKDDSKLPVNRYGIDRKFLLKKGLAPKQVDRIYRCLYVYSVGFFDLLKQARLPFSQIISVWKVFAILLEYSCKSDYKLMIAEIGNLHEQDKEKVKIACEVMIEERNQQLDQIKDNMNDMQRYVQQVEMDKENEKDIHLTLEVEYSQLKMNIQKEIDLRLLFEGMLNKLRGEHKDLEIRYDRSQLNLKKTRSKLKKTEEYVLKQNDIISSLETMSIEQKAEIERLSENVSHLELNQKKKDQLIKKTQQQHVQLKEQHENLQVAFTAEKTNIQDLQRTIFENNIQITKYKTDAAYFSIKIEEELKLKNKYQKENQNLFEEHQQLQVKFNCSEEKIIRLDALLKDASNHSKELRIMFDKRDKEYKDSHDSAIKHQERLTWFKDHHDAGQTQLSNNIEQFHELNNERHRQDLELQTSRDIISLVEKESNALQTVTQKQETLIEKLSGERNNLSRKCDHLKKQFTKLNEESAAKENALQSQLKTLKQIVEMEKGRKEIISSKYNNEKNKSSEQKQKIDHLKRELRTADVNISDLTKIGQRQYEDIEVLKQKLQHQIGQKEVAIEQIKVCEYECYKWQETLRVVRTQKEQEYQQYQVNMEYLQGEMEIKANQDEMITEDARGSCYIFSTFNKDLNSKLAELRNQRHKLVCEIDQFKLDLKAAAAEKDCLQKEMQQEMDEAEETAREQIRQLREEHQLQIQRLKALLELERNTAKKDLDRVTKELTNELNEGKEELVRVMKELERVVKDLDASTRMEQTLRDLSKKKPKEKPKETNDAGVQTIFQEQDQSQQYSVQEPSQMQQSGRNTQEIREESQMLRNNSSKSILILEDKSILILENETCDPKLSIKNPDALTKEATLTLGNTVYLSGQSSESKFSLAENFDVNKLYEQIYPDFVEFQAWFLQVAYYQLKEALEDYLEDPTINIIHLMQNVSPFDVPPKFKQINLTEENRMVLLHATKQQMQLMIDKMKKHAEGCDKDSPERKTIELKMEMLDSIYIKFYEIHESVLKDLLTKDRKVQQDNVISLRHQKSLARDAEINIKQIRGTKPNHTLIKMPKSPNRYEKSESDLRETLRREQIKLFQRPSVQDLLRQQESEEVARSESQTRLREEQKKKRLAQILIMHESDNSKHIRKSKVEQVKDEHSSGIRTLITVDLQQQLPDLTQRHPRTRFRGNLSQTESDSLMPETDVHSPSMEMESNFQDNEEEEQANLPSDQKRIQKYTSVIMQQVESINQGGVALTNHEDAKMGRAEHAEALSTRKQREKEEKVKRQALIKSQVPEKEKSRSPDRAKQLGQSTIRTLIRTVDNRYND